MGPSLEKLSSVGWVSVISREPFVISHNFMEEFPAMSCYHLRDRAEGAPGSGERGPTSGARQWKSSLV